MAKCGSFYFVKIIEDDGSLLEAISIGIYAALHSCTLPKVNVLEEDECNEIEVNEDENLQLDPITLPIMITFYKVFVLKITYFTI